MPGDTPSRGGTEQTAPSRDEWPFPPNEFIPASRLVQDEATDEDVRRAVQRVEDGDPQ